MTKSERDWPAAESDPANLADAQYPQLEIKGTVTVIGDVMGPAVPEDHWESLQPARTRGQN